MLGGQRLRPSSRQGDSVEFSPIRMIAVVIGIALVLLIGNMVLSRFRGAVTEPKAPPSVPETSALSDPELTRCVWLEKDSRVCPGRTA